ncbi:class IIb bacteriocin, lactobin A/cerein 7B family [Aureibacter tunicatorum]|uniref:Lactobin A/cerein 7B family class IIb bacteriocin n=2 Tax=Aureibacter tunicatorum TaxID=866807 RepID=A0AAE4BRY2_9BACT|nr:class IIb bacteriocin, lactobin A/cerein 7B family [Aureibacter tunicatorum]MDR6240653.1 lactobin A/cerein 7B family class IIb bacteriocin [Aureibacter tunicatorum]MDR6240654.1 lactobin A/cerein 7B family class IIb bacteriocin [Aureibacter tunicatorum]BDD06473.1 hypothetical protein AUTU_39560 [Aureibacter tunicatorum]BDD06474.1 hypothetical protein AUTU_39570 [Aureibacter tunicatorum]BDD06476.1 hypothetical protein AUTU_39590 [Aureibacter tunicatorum]
MQNLNMTELSSNEVREIEGGVIPIFLAGVAVGILIGKALD